MEKVEKIQYQAALAVTGTWQGSNRSKLYEELGWETSSDLRMCRHILQVHKISNDKTPYYLKDKLPTHARPPFGGNECNTFRELICRSNSYMKSFFPEAIASWNIFIKHFDIAPSYDTLKDNISLLRPKSQSNFDIHDPLGIRFLFQLRVGLSPLRRHKSSHNFINTPSNICHCNQCIEVTSYFHVLLVRNFKSKLSD